jgi:long-chain fatty acid transport protein
LWTWRVGYAHNNNPVPASEVMLNIVAPGVVTDHFTGGFSYKITPASKIDFAAAYVPLASVSGTSPAAFGAAPITLRMNQYQFSLGWTYDFARPVIAKY